jgi:DNA mismatch repair protein MutS
MEASQRTPMMKQYEEAKRACPDALLLFRMGDFYEMFHDDAKTAARVLGLALTSREKGENATPMAGFPYHQLNAYLGKLIAAGLRAAVCEQVEDPKLAKGLVRREVTRIVTPGTVTDDALLDPRESNFLAAVAPGDPVGLAWVELSTGRFVAAGFPTRQLADQLARIAPAECLLSEDGPPLPGDCPDFRASENGTVPFRPDFRASENGTVPLGPHAPGTLSRHMLTTRRPAWAFSTPTARQTLAKHFGTLGLEGFGFTDAPADVQAIRAAGAVLDYLAETQKSPLAHIDRLLPYHSLGTLEIDQSSRRSLEISRTIRDGRREGSLLWVLDRTASAMGSRLLADWVANPLTDLATIDARLDAVEELVGEPSLAADLADSLRRVYDVERLLARVTTGRATPRDLSFLGRTFRAMPAIKQRLAGRRSRRLAELEAAIDPCDNLRATLDAALADECPLAATDGGLIRDGFSAELDALRELARGGKQWIAAYQAREVERTGVATLKVGFNKVFGYYIEITNANREKIPPDYIRKQTVKNAERYVTPELKEYEEKILTADEKAKELEYTLFLDLRNVAAADRQRMQATAASLAEVDALLSLADLARRRNYCRPTVVAEPVLRILDGRHPVLDVIEPDGKFVPNDTLAGPDQGGGSSILLITGPNMAGKSTYIRQAALLTLMAQIGSFVPAREATIGLADRIFARVGASDELSRGQSTFMVEMMETARILHAATPRSLVILDEIGRGTSTYDGISLAWSVVEHLHEQVGCRTLFATHYHELTDLEKSLPGVKNLNVAVREWHDEVVFLHKIVEGAADKSYGIHVARLAGVPREVIERSKEILAQLEDEHLDAEGRAKIARPAKQPHKTHQQLALFGPAEHPLVDELRRLNLDAVTPIQAFQLIREWRERLGREGKAEI